MNPILKPKKLSICLQMNGPNKTHHSFGIRKKTLVLQSHFLTETGTE